jgi:HPt (histidine-containing phosphotransfer) domain-containing protein
MHHLSTPFRQPPHVVLADMQMPGTSGGALARALRDRCGRDTLLLAMSGSMPRDEATRDFDGLLLKPFTMGELTAAIAANGDTTVKAPADTVYQNLTSLDEAVYEKLAASMRRERLNQLYDVCLEDAEERIARMRQAASDKNSAAFRREAHALKGGAGMVGAIELQTLSGSLEEYGLHANHLASLGELVLACDRLHRILMARRIV